jgi:DNA-directed RNA polymerase specialized sigma subunit
MTAKEYLSQIRRIQTRLSAMADQLECLKASAEYISPQFSDMPRPATRNVHKNEDAIVRVIEWQEKMNDEYHRLADINAAINAVADPLLQSLLVKRYVKGDTWGAISRELFVGSSRVYQLHRDALAEIEKIIATDS